jgi:hypothetical protein
MNGIRMKRLFPVALSLILTPGLLRAEDPHTWMISTFSWVKRVPAEKGAPANGHPLRVEAEVLARALGSVRLVTGSDEEPLFDPAEAEDVAKAMAEALSLAHPDEDLALVSTSKRGRFVLGDSLAVTARVFARDGGLNLIVHDSRRDFMVEYRQETRMPDFVYGSRTVPARVVLKAPGAEARRTDWIVLPLRVGAPALAAKALPMPQPATDGFSLGKLGAAATDQPPLPGGDSAPAGLASAGGASTPSVVFSQGSDYTIQPNDRYVVLSSADSTITVPDPGGSNSSRALVILLPEYSSRLTIQCRSGSKLRHALDAFASPGSTCTFAASGTAPRISASITCVSDGSYWYCK